MSDIREKLWEAIEANNELQIALYVHQLQDVDCKDYYQKTSIMHASRFGCITAVGMLLDQGANINMQDMDGDTALTWAVIEEQTEMVKVLIDNGANLDKYDRNGTTALMYAAEYGYTEIVKVLLEKGAAPELRNEYGETALKLAKLENNIEIIRMLEEKLTTV